MKNYRKLFPLLIVLLMALATFKLFSDAAAKNNQLNSYTDVAAEHKEQLLHGLADDDYVSAIAMNNSVEYYEAAIEMHREMDDFKGCLDWAESLKFRHPEYPHAYELLLELYIQDEDYISAFKLIDEARSRGVSSELVEEYYNSIKYKLSVDGLSISNAGEFCGDMTWAKNGIGKYAPINEKGQLLVEFRYDAFGYNVNNLSAVQDEGIWFFVDGNAKRQMNVSYHIPGTITAVGCINNDLFSVCDGKNYSFYNTAYQQVLPGPYEDVGVFSGGMAPVKEGGKWYIIDANGTKLSQAFDDIKMDERGVFNISSRTFVKYGGKYHMLNTETMTFIENVEFDDAQAFIKSGESAAVKIKGKWARINADGEYEEFSTNFDTVSSFRIGLAAASVDGKYGFIDAHGEWAIEPIYDQLRCFNSYGVAIGAYEGKWYRLRLFEYNHLA